MLFLPNIIQLKLLVSVHSCNTNHDVSSGSVEATLARKLLLMMDLNGGLSFERNFSRHALAIMKPIHKECAQNTDGALRNEIIATLR